MVRATLSATSFESDEAQADGQADRLAGEGGVSTGAAALKIHHDEPTADAERIRVPFADDKVRAFVFVRTVDGTACVFFNGEHVETVEDHLSRKGVIIAALRALYAHLRKSEARSNKLIAGELNRLTDSMADSLNDFPPGEPCEWPIEVADEEGEQTAGDDEPPTDDTTTDDDIDEAGDVVCEGDVDDGSAVNSELTPPEGPAAVEIVAVAEGEGGEACGEKGDSEAEETMQRARAVGLYEHALARAKDLYVAASQHRVELQANVKAAKDEEAERLEEINTIEARGWQAFLPPKKSAPSTGATTTTAPAIPSPPSTLPPPSPESNSPSSPQAGAAGAATSEAHAANGPAYRDDWESVDIAELKLPKGTTTILREAGCGTMGALEKKRGSFDGLTSIAGIGETKRDAIEEAVLGWLSKNRDASAINAVREANHRAAVEGEGLALEMAAQGQ